MNIRAYWQPLAALALLFFAIPKALEIGGIWELQAHPVQGVTVKLHDGRQLQGALSRASSGDWILFASGGPSVQFDDHAYDWLQFTPPHPPPSLTTMLVTKWREHLLFFFVIAIAGVLLLRGISTARRPTAPPDAIR